MRVESKRVEFCQDAEKDNSSIFGKGTFGRKLLLTVGLLAVGVPVALAIGRKIGSLTTP